MHSIGIPQIYRRLPEDEGETPWTGDEAAAPAFIVIAAVAISIVLIAAAAFAV